MTTPAAIASQTGAPSGGVGAVRDTGAKSGSDAKAAQGEGGFDDVLSNLQKGGSGEPVSPKEHPRAGANNRHADIETQLMSAVSGADPNASLQPGSADNDPQATSEPRLEDAGGAQSASAQMAPLGLDATLAPDVVIPPALIQPSAQRTPDAAKPMLAPDQSSEPTAAPDKTPSDKPKVAEANVGLPSAGTAKEQLGYVDPNQRAAASDPILAQLSRQISSSDKDKWEPVKNGEASATATDIFWPRPADGSAAPVSRTEPPQRPKANVLRQETHFAPVSTTPVGPEAASGESKSGAGVEALPGDPAGATVAAVPSFGDSSSTAMPLAQQIADRVAAEATSAPESTERSGMTPLWQQGMKPALKVLHIQLQPADLGTVTVRMELKDTELTLHVEADRKETADLIRNDQDTLANLLRSAGYNVDTASVRIMDGDRTLPSQQSGQQSTQANLQSSTQSQSGASDRQGHAQRGGEGTNGGDTRPQTGRNDTNETTANRAGRGVYV